MSSVGTYGRQVFRNNDIDILTCQPINNTINKSSISRVKYSWYFTRENTVSCTCCDVTVASCVDSGRDDYGRIHQHISADVALIDYIVTQAAQIHTTHYFTNYNHRPSCAHMHARTYTRLVEPTAPSHHQVSRWFKSATTARAWWRNCNCDATQ